MSIEDIKGIITTYQYNCQQSYEKWCLENPGKIMMNDAIRDMCCTIILLNLKDYGDSENYIKYLETYVEDCLYKSRTIKTMNGFWVHAETVKHILTIIKKEND